ncbi:hypothetical protein ACLOJK_033041 [Asimina triloba]
MQEDSLAKTPLKSQKVQNFPIQLAVPDANSLPLVAIPSNRRVCQPQLVHACQERGEIEMLIPREEEAFCSRHNSFAGKEDSGQLDSLTHLRMQGYVASRLFPSLIRRLHSATISKIPFPKAMYDVMHLSTGLWPALVHLEHRTRQINRILNGHVASL